MEFDSIQGETDKTTPEWKPLSRLQRRVAGVLVEKSKTTPDIYPMTVNGIKTAANQKSNRLPKMDLDEDDVKETLDELRELGAVIEVIGDGRMPKYKHTLYEWFDVERAELAVMAELLLRGEQSLGDLRARAARMEKIAGINDLKPIVASLLEKNLMVELTPAGRGQVVTHNVYTQDEMNRLQAKFENGCSDNAPVPNAAQAKEVVGNLNLNAIQQVVSDLQEKVQRLEMELAEIKSILND